ncbi:hypothetical protein ACIBL6_08900 [Streptomyces sp. NPDC050400]|uniref:hypothetical protein n=1 Tax=Streptomyces sp. NPDC050400 TaxID=3365610 RepID=UPI0037A8A546
MSIRNKAKGTRAESAAVKYLREHFPAAERRALSGNEDRGDIAGVPETVGEVKAAERIELTRWQRETLTEMANAGAMNAFLLVKVPYKNVARWDFWMLAYQLGLEDMRGKQLEDSRWVRMDFDLGRDVLRQLISPYGPSAPSLPTTA